MSVQASLIAAVLPISAYLFFLWRADRFEKESIVDLLKHFLWGALGAVFLSLLGGKFYSYILEFFIPKGPKLQFIESTYMAPLFEEMSKAVFLIYSFSRRKVDDMTDGMVYGGTIGLGFGMVENFFYFNIFNTSATEWILVVLLRSLFPAAMHTIASATVGAFSAKALFEKGKLKYLLFTAGLSLAVFIHFIWNLSTSFEFSYYYGILFMLIIAGMFLTFFSFQVNEERKIIIRELKEECETGLIPYHYLPVLASKMKDEKGWIEEEIRNEYIEAAIKLAFRKNQLKKAVNDLHFFEKEVLFYKNRLLELSNKTEN
jgi:RsiW-degrading membrane proteinase PrsW (M82 family)